MDDIGGGIDKTSLEMLAMNTIVFILDMFVIFYNVVFNAFNFHVSPSVKFLKTRFVCYVSLIICTGFG